MVRCVRPVGEGTAVKRLDKRRKVIEYAMVP